MSLGVLAPWFLNRGKRNMSNVAQESLLRLGARLSCRLELLPGAAVADKIARARDFGFDAVALPGRYLDTYRDDARKMAGKLPLPFSSISLGFRGSLVSPSPSSRRVCRQSLASLFELCQELGVPFVNMPPALAQDNPRRFAEAGARDELLVRQLPELAELAWLHGVTLLLEPVNRYESEYLHSLGHAAALCGAVGAASLGITADLFHMQLEERNVLAAIAAAGKWIKLVHVAENTREEPGVGSMDFAAAFSALIDVGYEGYLEVESRSLSGAPEQTLPRAAAYLRRAWDDAAHAPRRPQNRVVSAETLVI